jgi:hypothetical protein
MYSLTENMYYINIKLLQHLTSPKIVVVDNQSFEIFGPKLPWTKKTAVNVGILITIVQ